MPLSMFYDNGDMRITKSKSILQQKLQVEVSDRICQVPDAIIIDGCAMLWVIPWQTNVTVKDLMQRKKKFFFFFFLYRQYINKNIFHLKFFKNSH